MNICNHNYLAVYRLNSCYQENSGCGLHRSSARSAWRVLTALLIAFALQGVTACGGGGSGESAPIAQPTVVPDPEPHPHPDTDPSETGTVTVSVTDAFGTPASGAFVYLHYSGSDTNVAVYDYANEEGILEFTSVAPGRIVANASEYVGVNSEGYSEEGVLEPGGHLELAVATQPWSPVPVMGVTDALAATGGVSADGRSLTFSLRILNRNRYDSIAADTCTPDSADEYPGYPESDCIQDPLTSFDAPYHVTHWEEAATSTPELSIGYSTTVVLDQGDNLITGDPRDARLYMLKYFLMYKPGENPVAVAAFGASDSASGAVSTLPRQPITIFPVEDPQFICDGASLFPAVDSLEFSEGGTSPLYAALSEAIAFTITHSAPGSRRVMVVVADGSDTTCGNPNQCQQAQQAVVEQLRANQIELVTVGIGLTDQIPDESRVEFANGRALSQLAEQSGGIALWAEGAYVLPDVFKRLPAILDRSEQFSLVRVQLESPVEGAFASGRVVRGTLTRTRKDGDGVTWLYTSYMRIPFEVRIP